MDTMMVIIDDKIISTEIFTECFACDYGVCGGACCIIGDSGAPMEEDEPERIEANYEKFSPLMSPEGRAVIEEKGFFEVDSDGDTVTPLVPGREECAYAACDAEGGWFCTIERSWCRGGSDFVKPISCRLYPIRQQHFLGIQDTVLLAEGCEESFGPGGGGGMNPGQAQWMQSRPGGCIQHVSPAFRRDYDLYPSVLIQEPGAVSHKITARQGDGVPGGGAAGVRVEEGIVIERRVGDYQVESFRYCGGCILEGGCDDLQAVVPWGT